MLNVLMVAAENDALPKGKVGGIGDVIRDIPKFLAKQHVHVDVVVPSYQFQSSINKSSKVLTLDVPFNSGIKQVDLYQVFVDDTQNVSQWVLEHPDLCVGEPGQIYFDDGAEKPFYSDANKFSLFCAAVCELVATAWLEKVDVLHLHDWHSAVVAVLREYEPRYQALKSIRTVYSIHNLAIQGIRPLDHDFSSLKSWFPYLPHDVAKINDPKYPHCFNPTRAAINLSDAVHVVSPTYAKEIMKPSDPANGFFGGENLEYDLIDANEEGRLFGFLNGCDYEFVPPKPIKNDDLFSLILTTLRRENGDNHPRHEVLTEAINRTELWKQTKSKGPLSISIGRLTEQKLRLLLLPSEQGLVIDTIMQEFSKFDARLIILGSGDVSMELAIKGAMARNPNLLFINGYFENLSQQLYVNGDLFLMPSSFEPCGISQMLAMRAGQPCIAHRIGGLSDTIMHFETGFLFYGNSLQEQVDDLNHTLAAALNCITTQKRTWNEIKKKAKNQRFFWADSIRSYIRYLYNHRQN